jgi:hypothetical protein
VKYNLKLKFGFILYSSQLLAQNESIKKRRKEGREGIDPGRT